VPDTIDRILGLLACNECRSVGLRHDTGSGSLLCDCCGRRFPIINNVASFVPDDLAYFSEVKQINRQHFLEAKQMAYFDDSVISNLYNHYHRYAAV